MYFGLYLSVTSIALKSKRFSDILLWLFASIFLFHLMNPGIVSSKTSQLEEVLYSFLRDTFTHGYWCFTFTLLLLTTNVEQSLTQTLSCLQNGLLINCPSIASADWEWLLEGLCTIKRLLQCSPNPVKRNEFSPMTL